MTTMQPNNGPRCRECSYDLQGLVDPDRCPECGLRITPSMLEPILQREPDPGDAIERSGIGIIGACTWCSALLLSGLMLKPFIGGLIIMVFLLASIARFLGWLRLSRGPLRRFDTTRFELFARGTTFLELGYLIVVLALWFGPWKVHIVLWWLVTAAGVLIGALGIAGPAIASALVGRRAEDPMLQGVGIIATVASLIACLTSLATLFISFGILARGTPASGTESLVFYGVLGTTLALTAVAAHFGRIAIIGIQSVLLEAFIEHTSDRIQGTTVGGKWIAAQTRRGPRTFPEPVESEPIPLSPRKPPPRNRQGPESQDPESQEPESQEPESS